MAIMIMSKHLRQKLDQIFYCVIWLDCILVSWSWRILFCNAIGWKICMAVWLCMITVGGGILFKKNKCTLCLLFLAIPEALLYLLWHISVFFLFFCSPIMKSFPTPLFQCYVMLQINRILPFIYLILNPLSLMLWDVSPIVYVILNALLYWHVIYLLSLINPLFPQC